MNELKDNSVILLKLRTQYKRIEQISWLIHELQTRFPLGEQNNEDQLLKNYLTLSLDLGDILNEINKLKKEYEQ
jgi:hypothetical protein